MLRLAYPRYINRNLQQFVLSTRLLSSTAFALNNNDDKTEEDNLGAKKKNVQSAVKKTTPVSSLMAAKDLQKGVIEKQSSLLENSENVKVTEEIKTNVTSIKKDNQKNWKNKRKKKPAESNIKADIKHLDDKSDKAKSSSLIDELDPSVENLETVIDKLHSIVHSEPDKKMTSVSTVKRQGRAERKNKGKKGDGIVKKRIPEQEETDLNVALKEAGTQITQGERRKKWGGKEDGTAKMSKRKGKGKELEKVMKMIESPEILQKTDTTISLPDELKTSISIKKKGIVSGKKVETSRRTKKKDGKLTEPGTKATLKGTGTDSKQLESRKKTSKVNKPAIDLVGGLSTDLFSGGIKGHSDKYTRTLHEKYWLDKIEKLKQTNTRDLVPNSFEVMMMGAGKQWKFPIDNEQDIGAEEFIRFDEHVFLEQYLNEFPDVDAIRKYMELVIIGLQQNPYLSVEEKRTRILWHKEYFESIPDDDEDLLLSS